MKGLNLDFKKIAVETAGNAAGLVLCTQVQKIGFIKNIQKPVLKGLVMIGLAKVALPKLAEMLMGKGKKGASDFVTGASQSMATYGIGHIMANTDATKNFVPAITGYENNPYDSLGTVIEEPEPETLQGYEDDVYN